MDVVRAWLATVAVTNVVTSLWAAITVLMTGGSPSEGTIATFCSGAAYLGYRSWCRQAEVRDETHEGSRS